MSRSAIRRSGCAVSVVIPTLNGGERFRALLAALARQDVEGGLELIVIDSSSDDGTWEAAVDAGAYVERIDRRDFNHGATRNRGIAHAGGDVVCLFTQDAVPMDDDTVRRLAEPYSDASIDGVYARQFPRPDCDPILRERLRRWSASRDEFSTSVLAAGDPKRAAEAFEQLAPMDRYLACAFDNVASSVRRSTWERHPLPARNFGEDVAWARQVLLAGGTLAFQPTARVEHSHRIDIQREFTRLYCDHKNLVELFGLRNVPSWGHVFRGWSYQRKFYAELLHDLGLPFWETLRWRAYSIPYALAETAAQFLGARSHWKAAESRFWRRVDERMRA